VTVSHRFVLRSSPRLAEVTASTIVSDDISSTNDEADVNGMSHNWSGPLSPVWRPRYSR
jgi:hypothetical protein